MGLCLYHYGKVDVTMEIRVAAGKQQWTLEAGSMLGDNSTNRRFNPYSWIFVRICFFI